MNVVVDTCRGVNTLEACVRLNRCLDRRES